MTFEPVNQEPYKIEFEIDSTPSSLNVMLRTNRFAKWRSDNSWYGLVKNYVRNRLPPQPLAKAKITYVRYSSRMLDFDNLVASLKPITDGLKHAGVLLDDKWKFIGAWDVDQEFMPKKLGSKIKVIVEEIK